MGIGLVYLANLFVPILEIDAAQYAEMSREMLLSDNWLELYDSGLEYLDKPPFLFWVSAFSMKLFGVSTWAYKLPSVLFAVWAIYALYKFTLLFYTKETAHSASILFASCQAMFLVTNDIKTDTILMSFVITAFWQLSGWLYQGKKLAWVWGALCIGGAMITKGPIGLLVIGFGFLPHFIIKKQWRNLYRWQYLPMLLLIGLVLLPMSIGLYQQFDLHPEKLVNNAKGVSGLRFFYWTQSFGRITGESVWNNNAGFSFLYSNLLWGLIPFTIFFLAATVKGFIKIFKRASQKEWISSTAVLLAYLSLGLSKFQLPHYIYVVLPFICLLLARYYVSIKNHFNHKFRILRLIHNILFYAAVLLFPILIYLIFPDLAAYQIAILVLSYVFILSLIFCESKKYISLLQAAVGLVILLNILLNFVFYPNLFPFQKEYTVAQKMKEFKIAPNDIGTYDSELFRSIDFLVQYDIPYLTKQKLDQYGHIVTSQEGIDKLEKQQRPYKILFKGERCRIGKLQIGFLNPKSRAKFTEEYFIVKIN